MNEEEVASWKWMPLESVKEDIDQHPEEYTEWFKIIFERFYSHLES
ncbi:MAG: isopentenyl-diphosphate delta-isomerase [Dokdonia sp.]